MVLSNRDLPQGFGLFTTLIILLFFFMIPVFYSASYLVFLLGRHLKGYLKRGVDKKDKIN